MDVQQALLSKIVHGQDIVAAVNGRITTEFFTDDRYKRVYQFLLDHWQKYGTPADLAVVQASFPSYDWPEYRQSIDYFMDALRERRKRAILTECMGEGVRLLQTPDDPDAMTKMVEAITQAVFQVRVETAPTLDADLIKDEEFFRLLDERMLDPGFLRGLDTGFRGINYVTGGFQAEQFVTLIGLPKSLKSAMLLYMAMRCHQQGKHPLFIGFEMSNDEQFQRLYSMASGVSLTRIMHGTLSLKDRRRIDRAHGQMKGLLNTIIFSVDIENALTVSGVQAKAMEYQPDILFIDGAYLMQSEIPKVEQGSAAALTDIARALKRLAQHMRIPIVVTTQASQTRSRGGKLTAESAMYTQAWRQSSDVLLGVERVEAEGPDDGEIHVKVKVLNSRSGPRAETYVVWDWNKGSVIEVDQTTAAAAAGGTDGDDD